MAKSFDFRIKLPTDKKWLEKISPRALEILLKTGEKKGLRQALDYLFEEQRRDWPQLEKAVNALEKAGVRDIQVNGRLVKLQHNPGRLANAIAPVSPEKIAVRPCPLCPPNMPEKQKALPFEGRWLAVCNPMPIFRGHLVLVSEKHTPQRVRGIIKAMIRFTTLTGLTTLYNGPKSGASIPDHLHIQAAPLGWLPLENQIPDLAEGFSGILTQPQIPQRIFLAAESVADLEKLFDCSIQALNEVTGREKGDEPELNLTVLNRGQQAVPLVVIHPRSRHRPSSFYAEGEKKFMVSPGAADMAGLVILPRSEDFERLDGRKMRSIYKEVCLGRKIFDFLTEEICKES